MAKVKIGNLPATSSLNPTDVLPVVDVGADTTYKITVQNLANSLTEVSQSISASHADNGGVTSIIAGSGISIDTSTGDVTITNTGGGGAAFPYTGSAKITGSLTVDGPLRITGSINTSAGVRTVDGVFIKTAGGTYNNYFALDGNDNLSIPSYGSTPYGIKIVDSGGNLFANFLGSATPQFVFTGSAKINGNLNLVNGGVTSSLFGTSSWALNVVGGGGPISVSGSTLYSTDPATSEFNTTSSIFFGSGSGYQATNANYSNFLGEQTGYGATSAGNSNFLGYQAGFSASGAYNSNFIGETAGYQASNAYISSFLGDRAGYQATNAFGSHFFGLQAGQSATNANNSIFIGTGAGTQATNSYDSIFLGELAGYIAPSADYSFFASYRAGAGATSANFSNFIGANAGDGATNASQSNFLGRKAGDGAINASNCNLFGYQVGNVDSGNGIGPNNIIIGTNITLEDNRRDSINIGAILFGTGSYSIKTGNTFSGSVGNGRIGINVINPSYNLDVSGSGNFTSGLTITGSLIVSGSPSPEIRVIGEMTVTGSVIISGSSALRIFNSASIVSGSLSVGNISPSSTVGRIDASNDIVAYSTSDARLKTEVSPIQDPITKVNMISGVNFTWIENPEIHGNSGKDVGVIAQELEAVLPEVVTTRENGYKAVKYEKIVPLLIEAIKDLQKQIDELKAGK